MNSIVGGFDGRILSKQDFQGAGTTNTDDTHGVPQGTDNNHGGTGGTNDAGGVHDAGNPNGANDANGAGNAQGENNNGGGAGGNANNGLLPGGGAGIMPQNTPFPGGNAGGNANGFLPGGGGGVGITPFPGGNAGGNFLGGGAGAGITPFPGGNAGGNANGLLPGGGAGGGVYLPGGGGGVPANGLPGGGGTLTPPNNFFNRLPNPEYGIQTQLPGAGAAPRTATPGAPAWSPGGGAASSTATPGAGAGARGSFSVSSSTNANGFRPSSSASSAAPAPASSSSRASLTNTVINSSTRPSTEDPARAAERAARNAATHNRPQDGHHAHHADRADHHAGRHRDHDGQRVGRVFKEPGPDKTFLTNPAKVVGDKNTLGFGIFELGEGEELGVGKSWLSALWDLLGGIKGLGLGFDASLFDGVTKLKVALLALGVGAVALLQKTTGIPLALLGDMVGKLKTLVMGPQQQQQAAATAADKTLLLAGPNDKSDKSVKAAAAANKPAGGFFAALGKGVDSVGKSLASILGLGKQAPGAADKSAAGSATGWKSAVVGRGMAAVGLASGGTAALALAEMVPLGPVGWAGVASGMAAAGLWQLLRLMLRDSKTDATRVGHGDDEGEDAPAGSNAVDWTKVRPRRNRRDYNGEQQEAVEPL